MDKAMNPTSGPGIAARRKKLAPGPLAAFKAFSDSAFADGALPVKTKQLIAMAVAHVSQCPYCIRGHTAAALKSGATGQVIMKAIWGAAEMRGGAVMRSRRSHSTRWPRIRYEYEYESELELEPG